MTGNSGAESAGRLRWYRAMYALAYGLGLTVWRRPGPVDDLVAFVEGPMRMPTGRALDLGCGTGTDSVYLAGHGWEVTAVDAVPRALALARRAASAAGVAPRFVQGDVTRLADLGIGDRYDLVLDFGCFHTLPEPLRNAYVASVSNVVAPNATLLLYGFSNPPKAMPIRAGITVSEVRERFAGWQLISAEQVRPDSLGVGRLRAGIRFELWQYQLQAPPVAAVGSGGKT